MKAAMYGLFIFLFLAAASGVRAAEPDLSLLPNPVKNAKIGQWAKYLYMANVDNTHTIIDIKGAGDSKTIVVEETVSVGETTIQSEIREFTAQTMRDNMAEFLGVAAAATITETKVMVKDKEVDGVVMVVTMEDGNSTRHFFSETVPITGMVRVDTEDGSTPILELLDYGQ